MVTEQRSPLFDFALATSKAEAERLTVPAPLDEMDRTDLIEMVEGLRAEFEKERVTLMQRNRELIRQNAELRSEAKLGNVLSKESFAECVDDAAAFYDEYEMGKLVMVAVKDERHRLRAGECIYAAFDLPRSFKVTGDKEFPELTAMRCDSPDRNGVAYEITVG